MPSIPGLLMSCLLAIVNASGPNFSARSEDATLVVNEVKVLTLKSAVAGHSPTQRAALAAKRLMGSRGAAEIDIKRLRKGHLLMAGANVILQIGAADARAYQATTADLAVRWQASINAAIALPPIELAKKEVTVPVGGTGSIVGVGREFASATLSVSNPATVTAKRVEGKLVIFGRSPGEATLTLTGSQSAETVSVRVMPFAANFPQTLEVQVVGTPASAASILAIVKGAIQTRLVTLPGSSIQISQIDAGALMPGRTATVPVKVSVQSPDALTSAGEVTVRVSNAVLAHRPESELWYCNDPERVQHPQSLYRGTLRRDVAVRLLYHHINDSALPLFLRVDVLNPSDQPAQLVLIPGDAKPDKNPVLAGLQAGDAFLRAWLDGSGEIVTIPPGKSLPLAFRRLGPLDTSSGLCYLRMLPGGPESLKVNVTATPAVPLDVRWFAASQSPTPWREVPLPDLRASDYGAVADSDHVYPNPFKNVSVTYRVGGNFGFLRVGQNPIAGKDEGQALDGNFGVIYRITALATNPTDKPATIEVLFESSAGYSGAMIVVDGELRKVNPMQPKTELQLARFRLEPGQSKEVSLMTIPLSGSSYPATITVRPVTF